MENTPDAVFIAELNECVTRYLRAVDAWETEFEKPGPAMEAPHREYVQARRRIEPRIARARRLCLKYGVRDPFPALMRVSLGVTMRQRNAPSAIGRGERNAIAQALVHLAAASEQPEARPLPQLDEEPGGRATLTARIRKLFG